MSVTIRRAVTLGGSIPPPERTRAISRADLARETRRHAPFLIVLAVAMALRVVTQFAYWPAMLFEDSYLYLDNADELDPGNPRPLGYPLLLRPLLLLPDLAAVPVTQHLMGLGMGITIYALLLRWGAWRWLAVTASIPVLWDGYQLQIEQMVMSDTLFQVLVLGAVVILAWRRPTIPTAALVGLLLGASVYVRLVGQPLVIPAIIFLLVVVDGWRKKIAATLVLATTFTLPLVGYMAWYHHHYGVYTLSDMGARVQYARVGRFVQCEQLPGLPSYQRPLCPGKPPEERLSPNDFVWSQQSPVRQYEAPPGMDKEKIVKDFVRRVIVNQPVDFLGAWLHDFVRGFYPVKTTHPPEVPVSFWQFPMEFRDWGNERDAGETAQRYGSSGAHLNEPLARFLRSYQLSVGYTPGTVLGIMMVLGALGTVGVGRARRSGMRMVCFLCTSFGSGLLLAAASYEFSWRYQLPALVLLPVAGGMGLVAMVKGGQGRSPAAGGERADVHEQAQLASATEEA